MINVITAINRIYAKPTKDETDEQRRHDNSPNISNMIPAAAVVFATYRFIFEHANATIEDAFGVQMHGNI